MTNRFGSPETQTPQAPRNPEAPKIPGKQYLGRTPARIFAGPRVALPEDEEDKRKADWEAFRAGRRAASYPEFLCFDWLERVKKMTENVDFVFQFPVMGGKTRFGGFVLDFFFPGRGLAWFVQGLEFHFVDPQDRARDRLARAIVSGRGVRVVEVFEDDIIQRTNLTLERAMNGEQVGGRRDI